MLLSWERAWLVLVLVVVREICLNWYNEYININEYEHTTNQNENEHEHEHEHEYEFKH